MSTAAINLAFDDFARVIHDPRALRLALLYGEELRIPDSANQVQVLSGKAWVSYRGKDYILGSGESLDLRRGRGGAIISPVAGEALFFEID